MVGWVERSREMRRNQILRIEKKCGDLRSRSKRVGRREGLGVHRNKLSKKQREDLKQYVRCDGSWTNEVILLTSHPSSFPQDECVSEHVSVYVCVFVSLKQSSRPPCAQNTTGCRSKSLERGLPVNEFPVPLGSYTPLLISTCARIDRHTVTPPC